MTTWDPDGPGPLPSVLVVGGTVRVVGGDAYHNIAYWDTSTSTWRPLGSGMRGEGTNTGSVMALTVYNGDLIASGNFVTAGGVAANSIARWSGDIATGSWQPLGAGLGGGSANVNAMSVYGTSLVVGGGFVTAGGLTNVGNIALWDGTTWQAMNNGFNQFVYAIAPYNGRLYACGSFSGAVNGNGLNGIGSWTAPGPWIAPGPNQGFVGFAMTIYDGELVMGGYAGNNGVIRKWNGSTWSDLGAGIPGGVNALTVYDDGSGPNLIAAGIFTTAGGAPANRIARWNGSAWAPMAAGFPVDVNAVTVYNGVLVAAGIFSPINGVPYSYVATWGCPPPTCGSADFNCDGDVGTDSDIASFFACLAGNCPGAPCTNNADFNHDGDTGTDADIESFFRVLAGGNC
jgi:hypothetical protein